MEAVRLKLHKCKLNWIVVMSLFLTDYRFNLSAFKAFVLQIISIEMVWSYWWISNFNQLHHDIEASESKWVNPNVIKYEVNSLRLGGLHIYAEYISTLIRNVQISRVLHLMQKISKILINFCRTWEEIFIIYFYISK